MCVIDDLPDVFSQLGRPGMLCSQPEQNGDGLWHTPVDLQPGAQGS
jgi:hypothetical protein